MPIEEDIKAIATRKEELEKEAKRLAAEYEREKPNDPVRASEINSLYKEAYKGVSEGAALLSKKREQYAQNMFREQKRIFAELETEEGAGFDKVTTSYVPSYGVPGFEMGIPGMQRSYDKVTYKRGKKTDSTIKEKVAKGLFVDPDRVKMDRNLSFDQVIALKNFTDPEEKLKLLRSIPGFDEVKRFDVGEEENYLIREAGVSPRPNVEPKDSYFFAFKPGGDQAKKIGAASLVELPRLLASLGFAGARVRGKGASLTRKADPSKKDLAKSVLGASLRSSAGYEGIEFLQKLVTREFGGMEQAPLKDLGSAALDTGVNTLIDFASFGVLRPLTKGAEKAVTGEREKLLQVAREDIRKKTGVELPDVPYTLGSPQAKARFQNLRRFRRSAIAREMDRSEEYLVDLQKGLAGEGSTPAQRAKMVEAMQREYEEVENIVARLGKRGKKYGQAALKREMNKRKAALGNGIAPNARKTGDEQIVNVDVAAGEGKNISRAQFDSFFNQAEKLGADFDRAAVVSRVKNLMDNEDNELFEASGVEEILRRVSRGLEPEEGPVRPRMSMREYRNMIRAIEDSTGSQTLGASTSQQVSKAVNKHLRETMDNAIEGTPLQNEWAKTLKIYDDNVLAFGRGSLKKITSEQAGGKRLSGSKVSKAILEDEKSFEDFMSAMYATGNGQKAELARRQLQAAFIEGGLTDKAIINKKPLIQSLWGRLPDGTVDAAKGQRAVDTLTEINRLQEKYPKMKIGYTVDEVNELSGYIGKEQKDKLMSIILQRNAQEAAEKKLLDNAIISIAKKGQWDKSHSDQLANALMDSRPSDTRQVLKLLDKDPSAKKAVKEDMRNAFFREYGSPTEGRGDMLIDGHKLLKASNEWDGNRKRLVPDIVAQMDELGDKETTDLIFSLARYQREALGSATSPEGLLKAKVLANTQGKATIFFVSDSVKDWALSHLYGTPGFKSMLRLMMKDVGSAGEAASRNKAIATVIFGRTGIQSAMRRAAQDPHFAADYQDMLAAISREEANK